MKRLAEVFLGLTLLSLLLGIGWTLGWRQALVGLVFSLIWFIIALVLLTKPPGIPKINQLDTTSDLPAVMRTDLIPVLPRTLRLRISLIVSCGICVFIWITLGR